MTHQDTDTLFPVESLPDDHKNAKGQRTSKSKWTTYERRDLLVTQEDIDTAMRQNSHSCMIADAIKRQVKGAKAVSVDLATIRWTDTIKNRRIVCLTPPPAQDGLVRFDLGLNPKPFSFAVRSVQITTPSRSKGEFRLDAEGNRIPNAPKTYVKRDGSVSEQRNGFSVKREGLPPRARVEAVTAGKDPVVLGGRPERVAPRHHASMNRKFGARAYTWLDGEDPASVVARQGLGRFEKAEPVGEPEYKPDAAD